MRRGATISISLLALAVSVAAAIAADIRKPAPPLAPVGPVPFLWTGFYVGVAAGGVFGNVDHYYDRQNGKNDHGQVWLDTSGFNLSALVGYNYQLANNWIIGAEGELGFLAIDEERIVIKDDDVLRQKVSGFGSVRARIGYAFDRLMVYATGGAGFARIENAGGNPANANRFLTIQETRPGFVVGGGAEYAFTPNILGRLEYLYFDTPEFEVRNLENEMMKFDNNFHFIRAALIYKF